MLSAFGCLIVCRNARARAFRSRCTRCSGIVQQRCVAIGRRTCSSAHDRRASGRTLSNKSASGSEREEPRSCERRKSRARRCVRRSERRRFSSANDDEVADAKRAMREQQASEQMGVGPSKYELQGPTVWPELSDVSSRPGDPTDPSHPSPATAASCLAVRILGSSQSRSPLRECVRDFYSLARHPQPNLEKKSEKFSCPPVCPQSHLLMHRNDQLLHSQLARLWTSRPWSSAIQPDARIRLLRGAGTGHQGLDLDADPPLRRVRALGRRDRARRRR